MERKFNIPPSIAVVLEWDNAQEMLDRDSARFMQRLMFIFEKNIRNKRVASCEL